MPPNPLDSDAVTSAKNARIRAIDADHRTVEHWIIRHAIGAGTPDEAAFAAEQAMIDILAIAGTALTNLQGGHVDTTHGALPAEELVLRYSAEQIVPNSLPYPHALILVRAAGAPGATPQQIYDAARGEWRAGPCEVSTGCRSSSSPTTSSGRCTGPRRGYRTIPVRSARTAGGSIRARRTPHWK
ncbi:hypothetical protein ACWEQ0_15185 [Nocardia thailandica]